METLEEKADEELAVVASKGERGMVEFNLGGVAPMTYQPPPDGHRKVKRWVVFCNERGFAFAKATSLTSRIWFYFFF